MGKRRSAQCCGSFDVARLTRAPAIDTRDARSRLKRQHEPFWRTLYPGLALGYRKGARGGTWIARKLEGRAYLKQTLGLADDAADADDDTILTFKQAQLKALQFGESDRVRLRRSEPTVADIIDQYIDHHRAHYKSAEKTWSRIQCHVLPDFGHRKVSTLTTSEISQWHTQLATKPRKRRARQDVETDAASSPAAPSEPTDPNEALRQRKVTANRALSVFKAALNFAYQQGELPTDEVWRKVKPFRAVDAARIRYLSVAEAKRLINAADPDFRALVRAALLTGARYGELINAKVEDYFCDHQAFYVRHAKNNRPRHVALTEEGIEFFDDLIAGRPASELLFKRDDDEPWQASHQIRRMKAACTRAKITPAVSFHDLRHTYASALAQHGVSLQVIAAALGHSDTRVTERHYAHMKPSYVADTIRANLPRFTKKPRRPSKVQAIDGSADG